MRYLLAFGSNLGNREENCDSALTLLADTFAITRSSARMLTAPLPSARYKTSDHGEYLNFVCEAVSSLAPAALYARIVEVENKLGHDRLQKWRPRALDIDVLFAAHNDNPIFDKCTPCAWKAGQLPFLDFSVPHAQFWQREFLVAMVTVELGISPDVLQRHFTLQS